MVINNSRVFNSSAFEEGSLAYISRPGDSTTQLSYLTVINSLIEGNVAWTKRAGLLYTDSRSLVVTFINTQFD